MGCNNCYNVSYHPCSTSYAYAGDCNAVAEYFANADLPGYTARFYSATPQEMLADFKYDRFGLDYSREGGSPGAFYVESPRQLVVDDSGSALPNPRAIIPLPTNGVVENVKKTRDEIMKAQREVAGKDIVLRELEVEELILRRIRHREVIIKDKRCSKDTKDRKKRTIIDQ